MRCDSERQSQVHAAGEVFDSGVNEPLYLGERHNLVKLGLDFTARHSQDRTVQKNILPAGPPFFPEDTITDVSQRFIVAELIREQVFRMTGEEIPYATAVTVDTFKEKKGGRLISIEATINLERSSQKGIIIGKNGSKLKQIGTRSREQIEQLLGTKVFLKLFVRIQKNWRLPQGRLIRR